MPGTSLVDWANLTGVAGPHLAGHQGPRPFPDRAGAAKVPLPGHPVPGPDRLPGRSRHLPGTGGQYREGIAFKESSEGPGRTVLAAAVFAHESAAFGVQVLAGTGGDVRPGGRAGAGSGCAEETGGRWPATGRTRRRAGGCRPCPGTRLARTVPGGNSRAYGRFPWSRSNGGVRRRRERTRSSPRGRRA